MSFSTFRLLQQIRLWIYIALITWGVSLIWYGDRHDGTGALLAISAVLLLYLEACPQCGRQVWREGQGWWTWWLIVPLRAWWIGARCAEAEQGEPNDR